MQLHHQKHHNAYVTNLNIAEEKLHNAIAKNDVVGQIALQGALKFNFFVVHVKARLDKTFTHIQALVVIGHTMNIYI